MGYYRSGGSDSTGSVTTLIILAFIGLVSLCSNLRDNSQKGMINVARNESIVSLRVDKYGKYLTKYPVGKYSHEAENAILSYLDDLSFDGTLYNGNNGCEAVKQIEKYKERYSGTSFTNRIDSLLLAKVDQQYRTASSKGTIEAWHTYQNMMPEMFWKDSEKRIEEIENRDWGTESMAWRTAQRVNTLTAYSRYLELYPKGAHAKAADKKVIDLSVSNIFAGDHGTLPGMDKTSYSSSGRNTISVSNDTQYTLTLLYSGPDSKRLVLYPRSSGTVSLPNGTYRVAASDAASNVRSYAGTETLTGGSYDVSYYISTSRF